MADINLGVGGANSATDGYDIDNSVKTEAANNEYFYRSSPTQGNRQTFTFSFWHKRTQITGYPADPYYIGQGSNGRFHITGNNNPTIRFMFDGNSTELESSPRIRDTAAWYHIVLAVDTTQATSSNRVKLYVNGEQISWDNSKYPSQNATSTWMSTTNMYFNTSANGLNAYDNSGYWAEVCVIDGQQLAPTSFGEFDSDSGIWKPIDVSGLTFGNEGFYLDFEDSSDLGADVSGNNNDCTLNNIAAADQATDTPTNNFATLNPLWNAYNEVSRFTITEGGTAVTGNQSQTLWRGVPATIPVNSGKWYWEVEQGVSVNGILVGYGTTEDGTGFSVGWRELTTIATDGGAKMMYSYNRGIYGYNASEDAWQYGGGNFNTAGDIISVALDLDNGYGYFRQNGGSWFGSGDPSSGSSGTGAISVPWNSDGDFTIPVVTVPNNTQDCRVNFGGYTKTSISSGNSDANGYGNFEYAVPSGYYAICTKNIAEYG